MRSRGYSGNSPSRSSTSASCSGRNVRVDARRGRVLVAEDVLNVLERDTAARQLHAQRVTEVVEPNPAGNPRRRQVGAQGPFHRGVREPAAWNARRDGDEHGLRLT